MIEALKKNSIFLVGLIALIGFGAYWFLGRDTAEDTGDSMGIIEQPSQFAAVRAEILGTIATLQAVQLDITVLDEPAFRALLESPKLPEGPFEFKKRNPFLP